MTTQTVEAPAQNGAVENTVETTEITFALPAELARQVRATVESGAVASQNALARTAIEREIKRLRDEAIARAYAEAAADPLYMQDLEECMRDFAALDADSLRYIDVEPQYEDEASGVDGAKS